MTDPDPKTASSEVANPFAEVLAKVLTKTFAGHWIGEVFALDMAFDELADVVLCETIATDEEWAQELLLTQILSQVSSSEKRRLLGRVLTKLGMDPKQLQATLASMAAINKLRNTMAHSVMGEASIEGFMFKGYRRGKDVSEELAPEAIETTIANGKSALAKLLAFIRTLDAFSKYSQREEPGSVVETDQQDQR
jgi:hypothetical protein